MARSASVDYREFVKIAVDLPDNPKLGLIDDPAAGWAHVVAICYCRQHRTDGSFPLAPLLRRAGVKRGIADRLFEVQMWHATGHSCDRCPQPIPGMAVVHDYLLHQQSADEINALSDARREAGRKGAASRWHGNSDSNGDGKSHSKCHSNSHGNPAASGMGEPWQTGDTSMAEVEVEEELKTTPPVVPPAGKPASRKRPATRLPDDWAPTQAHADLAQRLGVDLAFQADQFRNHAEANDRRQASWDAAFRQWLGNAPRFARRSPPQSSLFGQTEGWQALKQTGTEPRLRAITGGDPC